MLGERHGCSRRGRGSGRHAEHDLQPRELRLRWPRLLKIAAGALVVTGKPERCLHRRWCPDVRRLPVDGRTKKVRSRNADDGDGCAVDDQFRIQHARCTAKTPAPIPIADYGDRLLADGPVVAGTEQATDLGTLAQRSEEIAGYQLQPCSLGTRITS